MCVCVCVCISIVEGNGNPLQCSCLENPMERGAWSATVHGVTWFRHNLATKPTPSLLDLPPTHPTSYPSRSAQMPSWAEPLYYTAGPHWLFYTWWCVYGSPSGSAVKNLPANARDTGDWGLIPGLGRSPGGGHGNPLQHPCLESPMDRGAWWATVHGVAQSDMMEVTWHAQMHTVHTHRFQSPNSSRPTRPPTTSTRLFLCLRLVL